MKDILNSLEDTIKNSRDKIVKKSLSKLDVVSREEFEIQKKILAKTRLKLEELEKKIDQLLIKDS
ncbi:accessory factor UbiK family protein [Francisella frigiditurris]|uniref:Membrane fusogenic activity family protein n=1 Tax=Francisella frigiditurris TaxID=1542390 RepID=A0A1J0KR98_9GAMM|nr:accessory factor UbiK family protein [Francisella frigiditurris]APC96280.1 membrane fusogenic activity family protein [Francisella frigiditurris]